MLQIKIFSFNPFQENTLVAYDESGEAVIIDPGNYEKYETEALQSFITSEGLKPVLLLNTHCHVDHVLGNEWVKQTYGLKLRTHQLEESQLRAVTAYAPVYGFTGYQPSEVDSFLSAGDVISWGAGRQWEVRFTPGHAPGHVIFYDAQGAEGSGLIIGGDVLFRESIGRTDLPGGHHETLLKSIREQIFSLPDTTVVYPGHGPSTTVGHEKRYNPWLV